MNTWIGLAPVQSVSDQVFFTKTYYIYFGFVAILYTHQCSARTNLGNSIDSYSCHHLLGSSADVVSPHSGVAVPFGYLQTD